MKRKLKQILSALLVAVMLLTAAPLSGFVGLDIDFSWLDFNSKVSAADNELATTGQCGDNVYWNFDKDTGLLTISGSGEMYDYEEIWDAPFYQNKQIKNVIITDGVSSIGLYFLYDCENVESVTISDSVTIISEWAFCRCTSLRTVLIGNGVIEIKKSAFAGCSSLENINLPDSLMFIGVNAFSASNISEIVIPDNVVYIGDCVFEKCSNLTNVVIGNSVQSIASFSFYKCTNLKSIVIPVSVIRIEEAAFSYCDKLTNVFYCGSKDSWYNIAFESDNGCLHGAAVSYNYCLPHTNHVWSDWTVDFSEGVYSGKKTRYCLEWNEVETADISVGDVFEFGSYPQSEITDSDLIVNLEIEGETYEWLSYGYFSGTGDLYDGEIKSGDFMLYKDFYYNGTKYRAVQIKEYRPFLTKYGPSTTNSYQDNSGYYEGNIYYFEYEPLTWRVLDPSEGYVMCNKIIDSQTYQNFVYYNGSDYYNSKNCENYASDYATSSLRQWLNNDFYNTAFSAEEKAQLGTSHLKNKNTYLGKYDSEDTNDKIFVISQDDATNSAYGFDAFIGAIDTARRMQGTDYSKSQGLYLFRNPDSVYNENSRWWLRSSNGSNVATIVDYSGLARFDYSVNNACIGVVPAFKFNPESTTGDINKDGMINSSDALLALQHSVGVTTLTGKDYIRADVTKDNVVNSNDALQILRYSVGMIESFDEE